VTLEDDNRPRAEMPCGHAIGAQSMYQYIKWRLSKDLTTNSICCPECEKQWDWNLVAQVADLSLSENLRYQQIMADRIMKRSGIKKCPKCQMLGQASESLNIFRAECASCKTNYCWACEKVWKKGGLQICGNENCPVLEIQLVLDNCEKVTAEYSGLEMPKIRACPRCLTFVEHNTGCKHMLCKGCKWHFCFSCLKVEEEKGTGKWSCGKFSDKCTVAAVQKLY